MARVPSVSDIILEVREQADEQNTANRTDAAIVRTLNRGLRWITSELARTWPDMLIARSIYSPSDYDQETGFELPPDAFEDRILFVQSNTPSAPTPILARSWTEVSGLDTRPGSAAVPVAWYLRGPRLFFAPSPLSSYDLMVDYVRQPDPLVKPIGRINTVDLTDSYVICDPETFDLAAISSASDDRSSYVNVVDGLTGIIKGTHQVRIITGSKVEFRTLIAAGRPVVEGRTVSQSLTDTDPANDDYICPVAGTCVLQLGQAFSTYLAQYGIAEVDRALGASTAMLSKSIADSAAKQAEQQRAGRPAYFRVKNRSGVWGQVRPSAYPYIPR